MSKLTTAERQHAQRLAEAILANYRKWNTTHGGERERALRYYDQENRHDAPIVAEAVVALLTENAELGRHFDVVRAERDMHYHIRACASCHKGREHRCEEGHDLVRAYRIVSTGGDLEVNRD